ncbi:MAG: hypothetical protein KFF72_14675, partial [Arthrospira sp. SH-MAG29]|nr:hypothetical protein [Arthrospira sp. SH-MAG29]
VGVGIAGGAIVASSSGLLFEPQPMTFPWQAEFGRYPHPFLSAFAISSLVAYFAFKAAKYWIEKGRSL